jgi:hypothetical protein
MNKENEEIKELKEILKEGSYKGMKGFLIGYTIQNIPILLSSILKISSLIMKRKIRIKDITEIIKKIMTNLISKNVTGFGVSIGVINGFYSILKNVIKKYTKIKNEKIIVIMSSLISSFGIIFDNSKQGKERRLILSLYFMVRSLVFLYRILIKYNFIHEFKHLDSFLFIISCYEIMSSWFYNQETLPKAYSR